MKLQNVVIVDGIRSPFSWGGRGKFEATRMDEVAVTILRTLMDRNPKVRKSMIEDVGVGTVSTDVDLTGIKTIPRMAGLLQETAYFHSHRECASSMETMQRIASFIMVGASQCGIALGVERMGRVLFPEDNTVYTRATGPNSRSMDMTKEQRDLNASHDKYFSVPIPEAILDTEPFQPMPQTAQNVVDMYGLTREELDEYAIKSHHKAHAAYEAGVYKDEVIPFEVEEPVFDEKKRWVENEKGKTIVFDRDECIRPGSSMETMTKLNPIRGLVSFCGNEVHITAGNSCPTNSGASALLLMSEEMAIRLGLEPLARIVGMGVSGVKGQIMGVGPVPATRKALEHASLSPEQIDRVEFNEAFAAQVIPSLKELGISEDIVNVNGGSLGIGHPIGATGARLVMTVAKELRRSKKRYGLATQCMGAGMGMSTIIEALD